MHHDDAHGDEINEFHRLARLFRYMFQPAEPCEIRGRQLRYLLTSILREADQPLTVAELVERCEDQGVVFTTRPSKLISDALRWEIGRRRVRRVSRGVYCYAGAPRSTRYWIRSQVREIREYLSLIQEGVTVRYPWPVTPAMRLAGIA